jgi:hypothetical protein
MEGITLRPFDRSSDFPALARLFTNVRIQTVIVERLLEWENNVPPDRIRRTIVSQVSYKAKFPGKAGERNR